MLSDTLKQNSVTMPFIQIIDIYTVARLLDYLKDYNWRKEKSTQCTRLLYHNFRKANSKTQTPNTSVGQSPEIKTKISNPSLFTMIQYGVFLCVCVCVCMNNDHSKDINKWHVNTNKNQAIQRWNCEDTRIANSNSWMYIVLSYSYHSLSLHNYCKS